MHPKAQFTSNNAHKSNTHNHHYNLDDRFAPKPKHHQEDRLHDKNRTAVRFLLVNCALGCMWWLVLHVYGKILPLLFLVCSSAAVTKTSFEGVDPNKMSCDPRGEIFLLLPHFSDCKKFYMCAHGNEVLFNCGDALYFDFVLQTCNWPRDTKCWLRTDPDEIDGSGDDFLSDKADLPYDGSINSITGNEVANKVRPINIEQPAKSPSFDTVLNCMRADDASRLVPYKGDCQRYWHCVGGIPQTAYCTDGLFFNDHTQQCDFEANVKCTVEQEDELNGEFMKTNLH